MRNTLMLVPSLTVCAAMALCTVALSAQHKVRIIQTNSAGDNVHVIDPVTNTVVGVIDGIEVNHGAGGSPDGSRIYISDEAESTLDVVDAKTLKVIKKIPLSGHPNNMAVGKDGKPRVRRDHPGAGRRRRDRHRVDAAGRRRCRRRARSTTPTSPRTASMSWPAPLPGKTINVIDAKTEEPAWTVDDGSRHPPDDLQHES